MAVVVAFFICWAPFHTQRLISIYSSPDDVEQRAAASKALQAVLFYSSGILYYVSSVINPILYNIMSVKFRQAFAATILGCSCRRGRDDLARSRMTLAGDGATAAAAACRYRFAAAGGAGERSLEPGSNSDAGSQPHRDAADDDGPEEVRPLTSSLGNGRQVRQVRPADSIVLVDMHVAAGVTGSTANCRQTSTRRWFV